MTLSGKSRPASEARIVLLVEDDDMVRRAVSRYLEQHGAEVIEAASSLHALTTLSTRRVDVVVADHYLDRGGTTGLDLLETVQLRWPRVWRILFTGDPRAEQILTGIPHYVVSKTDRALLRELVRLAGV